MTCEAHAPAALSLGTTSTNSPESCVSLRAGLEIWRGQKHSPLPEFEPWGRSAHSLFRRPIARFSSRNINFRRLVTYCQMVVATICAVLCTLQWQFLAFCILFFQIFLSRFLPMVRRYCKFAYWRWRCYVFPLIYYWLPNRLILPFEFRDVFYEGFIPHFLKFWFKLVAFSVIFSSALSCVSSLPYWPVSSLVGY